MTPLEKFGLVVLEESREDLGDLDGGFLQDTAEELGLLVRTTVTEPCRASCRCVDYGFPVDCLRYSQEVLAIIESDYDSRKTKQEIPA